MTVVAGPGHSATDAVWPRDESTRGRAATASSRSTSLVVLAWVALSFNVLTPSANETILDLPRTVNQVLSQGSLGAALIFALLANTRIIFRLNAFLVLLSVLGIHALAVSIHSEFLVGSTYRAVRLMLFVGCLWLLTPWFGRRDMLLLRAHRLWIWGVLISVALGAAIAPGKAFSFGGRLSGALWPLPPTGVAHYAAILLGSSVVLWMCKVIRGPHAFVSVAISAGILVGTHTRTAMIGVIVGLAGAAASLFLGHARARRTSVGALVAAGVAATLFAPQIMRWAARGQSAEETGNFTGRAVVWSAAFDRPRSWLEELFGSGLSDKSYNGLAVDSSWVATYLDLGWLGVLVGASLIIVLLTMAATHVPGPQRGVALFLVLYCLVSSLTETGLGDASPYLLDLAVATSLLLPRPLRGAS
jgi:hypothetical protein